MIGPRIPRRAALLLPLLAAACGMGGPSLPPQTFPPLSYDYLTKIRLNVAQLSIDDGWAPRGASRHVESLSPIMPRDALRQMARDRLTADGKSGKAAFFIEDASIIQTAGQYQARFSVRLDIADENGIQIGQATATTAQSRPIGDTSPRAVRATLYELTKQMMDDMNVEFEYQVRRALKDALQNETTTAPPPAPVESEDLGGTTSTPSPAPTDPLSMPITPDTRLAPSLTPLLKPAFP